MSRCIRPVDVDDYPHWLRMRKAVYPGLSDAFHRQEMALYDAEQGKVCFMARAQVNDDPVAFVEVSLRNVVDGCLSNPVGYVEGIYVEPQYRGQGIGCALVRHAEAWSRSQGCSEMATDALTDDHQAQSFHRKMGFTESYRIVQFKRRIQGDD